MTSRNSLPTLVLNVPAIARRSSGEVQALLGRPDGLDEPQRPGRTKRIYQRGRVEVVFIDDAAGWIKLNDCRDLAFGPEALPKLGLPTTPPTYRNPGRVMSWKNVPRLQEVSLYAGTGDRVSFVLVCVQTTRVSGPKGRSTAGRTPQATSRSRA